MNDDRRRIVLVTGAASGIGQATAELFAAEGACLGLLDIDRDALRAVAAKLATTAPTVAWSCRDLSLAGEIEAGFAELVDRFDGRVDVLINNVGQCEARAFDDITDAEWLSMFELNFLSAVRAIRAVLPVMRHNQRGCIISVASDLARQPEASPAHYQVSKVALISLTKSLALAEGPDVRVNAVAPGPIWTPLWTKPGGFAETLGQLHGEPDPRRAVEKELAARQLPMRRLGTPAEVASVIGFMASDAASYVTGSVWGVDGGSIRGLL
jgi:NAD(P)-dependent dehydrogenase (short-subunit alcohol dehydrogenase family)